MPELHWKGKKAVLNHHLDVPYKTLEKQYTFNAESSENKIIHGDNLEALKALLPEYEGRIKCIYIDPPYNTGNENWVYNDNVNSPQIKKWLGQVVGKESEDLTRHDKWLCMMYPRLKLLHKLLADDGAIFISIDDNEQANLKLVCDEIFGTANYLTSFIWKKAAGSQNDAKYVAISHEYIVSYAKNKNSLKLNNLKLPNETVKAYKLEDEFLETRGKYQIRNLNDFSIGDRPGLHYDITCPDGSILYGKENRWRCDIFRFEKRQIENRIVFKKEKDKWNVFYKLYLNEEKEELMFDNEGNIIRRGVTPNSLLDNLVYTSEGGKILKNIFGEKSFDYPKPPSLVELFLNISTDKNSIILDSFAGSGTTAQAVLNLNKQDGGNRKFILVEMEDYAETITAERVRRVASGYSSTEGTGGDFSFYSLGDVMLLENGNINEEQPLESIRNYIYYTETKQALNVCASVGVTVVERSRNSSHPDTTDTVIERSRNSYFLGNNNSVAYYFYYEKERITTLNYDFLATIKEPSEQYVIYADNCLLPDEFMLKHGIIFKKIPRDVMRF